MSALADPFTIPQEHLDFYGVRVPKENVVGEVNEGFRVAITTVGGSRLGVAAQASGIAQGATANARERNHFGKPINSFQAVQFKLGDMKTQSAAGRELLYQACATVDGGDGTNEIQRLVIARTLR